jgi:ParB/RepB/Spo0J family partition protein
MSATEPITQPPALEYMPLTAIKPWADNPRPRARRSALSDAELVASIKARGILSSLVVRPNGVNDSHGGHYLIVAGERRYRAAMEAGLKIVPVTIRALSDAEALEDALSENIVRHDMHPMDEAAAFAKLRTLDQVYTVEALASRFGKPVAFIKRRLALLNLDARITAAFLADVITAGHAEGLAKLPKAEQWIAFEHGCFLNLMRDQVAKHVKAENWDELRQDVTSLGAFRTWLETNVKLDLQDPEVQEQFPEIAKVVQAAAAPDAKPYVEVSLSYYLNDRQQKALGGVLPGSAYKELLAKKDVCEKAEQAIVVHGGRTATFKICRTKTCEKHYPPAPPRERTSGTHPSRDLAKERKAAKAKADKEQLAREAWEGLKAASFLAMVPTLKKLTLTPALVKAMLIYADRDLKESFGLTITTDTAVACLVADQVMHEQVDTRADMLKYSKLIGWNFPAFEKSYLATLKAASKAKKGTPAKATKGRAR